MSETVVGQLYVVLPYVLGALGAVVGISFAVRWALKFFGGVPMTSDHGRDAYYDALSTSLVERYDAEGIDWANPVDTEPLSAAEEAEIMREWDAGAFKDVD